jgi:hypothetical protein
VERLPLALYSPPLPALVSAVLLPLLLLPSVLLPPVRVHPLAALLGMRAMPSCFRLALLLGSSLTWTIVAALPALAQTPMSPIFPTLSSKSAQAPAPKPAAVAPIASAPMPAPAVARPERDDPAVATAAIPRAGEAQRDHSEAGEQGRSTTHGEAPEASRSTTPLHAPLPAVLHLVRLCHGYAQRVGVWSVRAGAERLDGAVIPRSARRRRIKQRYGRVDMMIPGPARR